MRWFFVCAVFVLCTAVVLGYNWQVVREKERAQEEAAGIFLGTLETFDNTEKGFITVRHEEGMQELQYLNAYVDANENGNFEEDEWLVRNMLTRQSPGKQFTYYFSLTNEMQKKFSGRKRVRVSTSQETKTALSFATVDKWRENVVRVRPFVLKKNRLFSIISDVLSAPRAFAHSWAPHSDFTVFWDSVPDISCQKYHARCVPSSAAGAFVGHAGNAEVLAKFSAEEKNTAVTRTISNAFSHTATNSTLSEAAHSMNTAAQEFSVPAHAKVVGDAEGKHTIHILVEGMTLGATALLALEKSREETQQTYEHVVGVVGIHQLHDAQFLEVVDPLTPPGIDVYALSDEQRKVEDFALFAGDVRPKEGLLFGYFDEATHTAIYDMLPLATLLQFSLDVAQEDLPVVSLQGKNVPALQVRVWEDEKCVDENGNSLPHYHASDSFAVRALDGDILYDRGACGFGLVEEIQTTRIPLEGLIP